MIRSKFPTKQELDIVLRALKLTMHSTCGLNEFSDEELEAMNKMIERLEKFLRKGK